MAPHSSALAWKVPWTEEPGGLQSMGSRRVGHDWVTSLSLFTFMHWRRKWQPTPVFLPGESQGWGSLVGCRLWGRTESDTTEVTQQQQQQTQSNIQPFLCILVLESYFMNWSYKSCKINLLPQCLLYDHTVTCFCASYQLLDMECLPFAFLVHWFLLIL